MGFFCKEHAFHCMVVCRMLGHDASIKRGDLTFRLDESTVYSSFGSDTDHAWCWVNGTVPVDLSANFEYYESVAPNIDLIYGSGLRGRYTITYELDSTAYADTIGIARTSPELIISKERVSGSPH